MNKKKLVSGDAVLFLRYEDQDSVKILTSTCSKDGTHIFVLHDNLQG